MKTSDKTNSAAYLRVFLPKCSEIRECFLYGIKRKSICDYSIRTIDYFVIELRNDQTSKLDCIGKITSKGYKANQNEFSIPINSSNSEKQLILNGKLGDLISRVIFYYNPKNLLKTEIETYEESSVSRNFVLTLTKHLKTHNYDTNKESSWNFTKVITWLLSMLAIVCSKFSKILSPLFKNTVTYNHCLSWKKCLNDVNHSRNGFIILDIILGIVFMVILTHIRESGKYFMDLTEIIVQKLRILLTMLEGSPVGLKLNEQLNSFLLSCFMYHVDLWFNFIVIIEPAIHYLFLPISLIGLIGFSFQCAVICDLFTLLTLHAHCFYIYAAMLYKLEIKGLQSLWRIVLGRRRNVLKNRVESQEYTKRQLFLATLFFTVLLFLLPTVIIYYLVFASLRFIIYCVTFTLKSLQRKILEFPFLKILRWTVGCHIDPTNCFINILSTKNGILEVDLKFNRSFPWTRSKFEKKIELQLPQLLSVGAFAMQLVRGDIMAF